MIAVFACSTLSAFLFTQTSSRLCGYLRCRLKLQPPSNAPYLTYRVAKNNTTYRLTLNMLCRRTTVCGCMNLKPVSGVSQGVLRNEDWGQQSIFYGLCKALSLCDPFQSFVNHNPLYLLESILQNSSIGWLKNIWFYHPFHFQFNIFFCPFVLFPVCLSLRIHLGK